MNYVSLPTQNLVNLLIKRVTPGVIYSNILLYLLCASVHASLYASHLNLQVLAGDVPRQTSFLQPPSRPTVLPRLSIQGGKR